ncbi:MIF4G like-domain-containing protein [Limtongia smithiae]|uniref:MIF4G like-domain-containing protein n=1 Tax=Limtongia smithiae TaxID=1125753 RepID=UPI0034CDEFA7
MSSLESSSPYHQGAKRRRDQYEGDNKRQRIAPQSPFARFRRLFTTLGEPSRFTATEAIEHSARSLADYDFDQDGDLLLDIFEVFNCIVIEQPAKIFSLGAAIQIASAFESRIGTEFFKFAISKLQSYIDEGDWNNFKLFFRLLLMLRPIISNPTLLTDFLDSLLTEVVKIKNKSEDRTAVAENAYRAVLLTVPYIAIGDSSDADKELAGKFFERTKEFNYQTAKSIDLIGPFVDDDNPYKIMDALDLLNIQLESLAEANWELSIVADYSSVIPQELNKFEIATPTIPDKLKSKTNSLCPEIFTKVFLNQQVETTPPLNKIESTILRDILTDTLTNLSFNRGEVARQLVIFDSFFRTGLFAPREMSLEKLAQIKDGSTWKPEDVALEAVLANMFRLPQPPLEAVYYHTVIIEACTLAPHAIAPSFGRAIRFLYSCLDHLDVEAIHVFVDWFAHHLSNFGYTWKWKDWTEDLKLNELHPKRVLIRELLGKELRLSFPQRVIETLPPEFVGFVNISEDLPVFKFVAPDYKFSEQSRLILKQLREREPPEAIEKVLDEIRAKCKEEDSTTNPEDLVVEIYVTAIVHLGSRSLSHVVTWIERGLPLLTKLLSEAHAQRRALACIFEFWGRQDGVALQVAKKFVGKEVVSPQSLLEWILIDAGLPCLSRDYSWELLCFAIARFKVLVLESKMLLSCAVSDDSNDEEKLSAASAAVGKAEDNLVTALITVVRELSRPVVQTNEANEESVRWERWWKDGYLRAILRKYHVDYKEIQEPLKNLGLTDIYILSCIEHTAEI